MPKSGFTYTELKDILRRWKLLLEKEKYELFKQLSLSYAYELLYWTKMYTPVDTGTLQFAWWVDEGTFKQTGRLTQIELKNPMHYASFIEYGTEKIAPRYMLRRGTNTTNRLFPYMAYKLISDYLNAKYTKAAAQGTIKRQQQRAQRRVR